MDEPSRELDAESQIGDAPVLAPDQEPADDPAAVFGRWMELLQLAQPHGETDVPKLLRQLINLVGAQAAWLVDGESVRTVVVNAELGLELGPDDAGPCRALAFGNAEVGIVAGKEFYAAQGHMLVSRSALVVVRQTPSFSQLEREMVSTTGGVLDLAMVSVDRRSYEGHLPFLGGSSVTDPLTGLLDRQTFEHFLIEESKPGKPGGCVVAVAIDGLDEIESRLGAEARDEVVKVMGGRLRRCVRGFDVVSRTGEAMFGIYTPGVPLERAESIAERFRGEVERPFAFGNMELVVSCRTVTSSLAPAPFDEEETEPEPAGTTGGEENESIPPTIPLFPNVS